MLFFGNNRATSEWLVQFVFFFHNFLILIGLNEVFKERKLSKFAFKVEILEKEKIVL